MAITHRPEHRHQVGVCGVRFDIEKRTPTDRIGAQLGRKLTLIELDAHQRSQRPDRRLEPRYNPSFDRRLNRGLGPCGGVGCKTVGTSAGVISAAGVTSGTGVGSGGASSGVEAAVAEPVLLTPGRSDDAEHAETTPNSPTKPITNGLIDSTVPLPTSGIAAAQSVRSAPTLVGTSVPSGERPSPIGSANCDVIGTSPAQIGSS